MIIIKYLYMCFLFLIGKAHRIQLRINFKNTGKIKFGSRYGSKVFIDNKNFNNSIIISAGLGEDASFDIEFANKYNSKVLFIDPTPRAIRHFEGILSRLGKNAEIHYSKNGKQSIESYNLKNINKSQIILSKNALFNKKDQIKFFSPENDEYVSHSINQNQVGIKKNYINVNANTLKNILKGLEISTDQIFLIKLDIEGAETIVLENILNDKIFPHQFLIEYDDLENKNSISFSKVDRSHKLLLDNGYKLKHRLNFTEFLYVNETFK